MRVIDDATTCTDSLPNLHLTIGNYDGLHLGHQAIIRELTAAARESGGTAALMTLRPHPAHVFSPETAPRRICNDSQMRDMLAEMGMDVLFVFPFTAETSLISRDTFLNKIILGRCQARHLFLGHDFAFGHKAEGNIEYLRALAPELGYTVHETGAVALRGDRISSSGIRRLILGGELDAAAERLGRPYAIRGTVGRGRGIGADKLGFPTANFDPSEYVLPPLGIYAARARIVDTGDWHLAAINLGFAPTYAHDRIMLEAYLLDFSGDLTGKTLDIEFARFLRPEVKYNDKQLLIEAIARDVAAVRAHFA